MSKHDDKNTMKHSMTPTAASRQISTAPSSNLPPGTRVRRRLLPDLPNPYRHRNDHTGGDGDGGDGKNSSNSRRSLGFCDEACEESISDPFQSPSRSRQRRDSERTMTSSFVPTVTPAAMMMMTTTTRQGADNTAVTTATAIARTMTPDDTDATASSTTTATTNGSSCSQGSKAHSGSQYSPTSVVSEEWMMDPTTPLERLPLTLQFFAVLLQNSISDLLRAAQDCRDNSNNNYNSKMRTDGSLQLLSRMCERLQLPQPSTTEPRLRAKYNTPKEHMQHRAGLVLEEARYTLCEDLYRLHVQRLVPPAFSILMKVSGGNQGTSKCAAIWDTGGASAGGGDGPRRPSTSRLDIPVVFQRKVRKTSWFTPAEIKILIPGLIVQCTPVLNQGEIYDDDDQSGTNVLLGLVSLTNSPKSMLQSGCLTIVFFDPAVSLLLLEQYSEWMLRPVGTSHLTTSRQFAALMDPQTTLVPFFDVIRGNRVPFNRRATGECQPPETNNSTPPCALPDQFRQVVLNPSQQNAATTFLHSPIGSVTMVQGPPGTGKTTFCVGVICQYLMQALPADRRHRIMICAPTNKAISHIVKRFLDAVRNDPEQRLRFIVLGNHEKLGVGSDARDFPFSLKSVFLYSWVDTILNEYGKLKFRPETFAEALDGIPERKLRAQILDCRMRSYLGQLPRSLESQMKLIVSTLEHGLDMIGVEQYNRDIDYLIAQIKNLDQTAIRASLVNSAHVIFSTLSASRSGAALGANYVDCLIVDEAAAATEPALYIPFHLQPLRMLVVGDPLQLPAVVASPLAQRLGLDESLHSRLMERLHCREILLMDTQYRMKPEISCFPSRRFYHGMLQNGPNVTNATYGSNAPTLLNGQAYLFLQVNGEIESSIESGSSWNRQEANVVVDLVCAMKNRHGPSWCKSEEHLRIITFYKEQVSIIRSGLVQVEGLRNVSVGTVDSTQGCEADVVIVSFVKGRGKAGFLKDDRRINVALTRARYQLICVGNVQAMRELQECGASTLRLLSLDAFKRGAVVTELTNNY